jgi:hypothetical protein
MNSFCMFYIGDYCYSGKILSYMNSKEYPDHAYVSVHDPGDATKNWRTSVYRIEKEKLLPRKEVLR